jgi:gentisate 1,2-dioxygenase
MSEDAGTPIDMADLPVQKPHAPVDIAQARARFFNSGNAFDIELPAVPARVFEAPAAGCSGWFDCDQSEALDCGFPATTPLMLARYACMTPAGSLTVDVAATGSVWYVIAGSGRCSGASGALDFGTGDVFLLPGGESYRVRAGAEGAMLWTVGNEPQLAFEGTRPAVGAAAPIDLVHYPAAEIERQFALLFSTGTRDDTSGRALIFSSDKQESARGLTPTLTLSFNTLAPHSQQRAHRHNSAAVTLVVQGEGCHSRVGGERCAWMPWATLVTPAAASHSHHNEGAGGARFLIVQDGGLHYHARTMGFEFLETPDR